MRTLLALALAFALLGCGSDSPPPIVIAPVAPPPASGWVFQFSPNMTAPTPIGNGFTFQFPATDGAHYLVRSHVGPLTQQLSITYQIDVTGTPFFQAANDTCPGGGKARLYFQKAGDTLIDEFGRWWAGDYMQDLAPGTFSITAPISETGKWGSVYGKKASDPAAVAGWAAALANVGAVGVTFGNCFGGHGVYTVGGTATFTSTSFTAQ